MCPGHERRGIAQHEQSRTSILVRIGNSTHHILPLPKILQLRVVCEVLRYHLHVHQKTAHFVIPASVTHWRHDIPRAKYVDTNCSTVNNLAPLHSQAPAKLDDGAFGGIVHARGESFVGNQATHRANQNHRAGSAVFDHLVSTRNCAEIYAAKVNVHHLMHFLSVVELCFANFLSDRNTHLSNLLWRIFERWRDELHASCSDQAVKPAMLARDFTNNLVDVGSMLDVHAPVMQTATEMVGQPFLGAKEVLTRLGKTIEAVDCKT